MAKTSEPAPTFYVTTPIYYVNDVLHLGHAYTTIIADILARAMKLRGRDVFFLTGTDEHGQKIEKAAAERGLKPKELADQVVGRAVDLWKALDIGYDFFIRTTMPEPERGVQQLFQKLVDKGDIYKGEYKGWYCVSDENFLTEDVPLNPDGLKTCPDCGKSCALVCEECYFFRLSAYEKPLLDFYVHNPEFVRPASRMNEVTSFVKQGLRDLSITRSTVKWGIPVPNDPKQTIYVWFDALHNYLTGIGYGSDEAKFRKYWPADLQLMAKDILRFHAVFWPAFLMAGGFELPRTVFAHGWWLKDNTKMSKSKGNVLDPFAILKWFGPDPLRYFLMREIPIGMDGNFSHEAFIHRVNSDLANDLGNLVQRTLTMIQSYFGGAIDAPGPEEPRDVELRKGLAEMKDHVEALYDDYALNRALEEVWLSITAVNKYLADHEPWKMAKDPALRPRLARVLFQAAAALRLLAHLLYPVMPGSMAKVWEFLGETQGPDREPWGESKFENYRTGQKAKEPTPLFPRVALKDFLGEGEVPAPPAAAVKAKPAETPKTPATPSPKEKTMDIITYEEFQKMDLRVALVLSAERVAGATKLLKLEVDLGTEKRTMIAGVAETYAPEDMVGKRMIVIANLKPAVIRGIESQAMLLAAVSPDNKAIIPFFDRDVAPGTKVK